MEVWFASVFYLQHIYLVLFYSMFLAPAEPLLLQPMAANVKQDRPHFLVSITSVYKFMLFLYLLHIFDVENDTRILVCSVMLKFHIMAVGHVRCYCNQFMIFSCCAYEWFCCFFYQYSFNMANNPILEILIAHSFTLNMQTYGLQLD